MGWSSVDHSCPVTPTACVDSSLDQVNRFDDDRIWAEKMIRQGSTLSLDSCLYEEGLRDDYRHYCYNYYKGTKSE
jgi:hypothetical protein